MPATAAGRRPGAGPAAHRRPPSPGARLLLVLTVSELEEEPGVDDGYNRTRAFYRSVGFVPARELPDLWPDDRALLLAMPLA